MLNRSIRALAAALLAGAGISSAQAATYVVTATYDPATLVEGALNIFTLAKPLTLKLGDTVDLTVKFTGGALVSFPQNHTLSSGMVTSQAGTGRVDTTLSFGEPSANLAASAWDQQNFMYNLVDYFVGSQFQSFLYRTDSALDPSVAPPIAFSSFRNVLILDRIYSGAEERSFDRVGFLFGGASPVVLRAGAVPEPASWAMMIGGFALIGGLQRRRSQAQRAPLCRV